MPPIRFDAPLYLWLLLAPAALAVLWVWQLQRRRRDTQMARRDRTVPVREQFAFAGGLWFWLCLVLAIGSLVLALARPQVLASVTQNAGADFIILQDGSTSMRVSDAPLPPFPVIAPYRVRWGVRGRACRPGGGAANKVQKL